jgi:hypothetical protein
MQMAPYQVIPIVRQETVKALRFRALRLVSKRLTGERHRDLKASRLPVHHQFLVLQYNNGGRLPHEPGAILNS